MTKGLKALDEIRGYVTVADIAGYVKEPIKKVYKAEFSAIKKELKALELIKEKEVNVQIFEICQKTGWSYEVFEHYCSDNAPEVDDPPYKHPMTQEEFNLLKEVLE